MVDRHIDITYAQEPRHQQKLIEGIKISHKNPNIDKMFDEATQQIMKRVNEDLFAHDVQELKQGLITINKNIRKIALRSQYFFKYSMYIYKKHDKWEENKPNFMRDCEETKKKELDKLWNSVKNATDYKKNKSAIDKKYQHIIDNYDRRMRFDFPVHRYFRKYTVSLTRLEDIIKDCEQQILNFKRFLNDIYDIGSRTLVQIQNLVYSYPAESKDIIVKLKKLSDKLKVLEEEELRLIHFVVVVETGLQRLRESYDTLIAYGLKSTLDPNHLVALTTHFRLISHRLYHYVQKGTIAESRILDNIE